MKIYYDNLAICYFFANNNKSESWSKYVNIKNLGMRECVKENKTIVEHINTKLMIVDLLTKGMPTKLFKDHVMCMGLDLVM